MNIFRRSVLVALFGFALAGCDSGNSSPTCTLENPSQFPPTPQGIPTPQGTPLVGSIWPKFRANLLNTGTVNNVTVAATGETVMFPRAGDPPKGHFIASPVIGGVLGQSPSTGQETTFIYIGSTDSSMYKLSTGDLTQDIGFNLFATNIITSTALVAVRDGLDAIFVGGGDTLLHAVAPNSELQTGYWPFAFNTAISASPTLDADGTLQLAAQSGTFASVCPNGIARWVVPTAGNQSSAALSPDGIVYFGSDNRELHAIQADDGATMWAFSASAPILASPVLEVLGSSTFVYAADRGGHVYKIDATNGRPIRGFDFAPTPAAGPIWSSPALGNHLYTDMTDPQNPARYTHLYFGSDDGNLYAIRTDTGDVDWSFHTGGPIVSSPAVAIDAPAGTDAATTNVVVVVKSNDGTLYFLKDTGSAAQLLNSVTIDNPIPPPPTLLASSPAIDVDGTVYIGSEGGRVYAIK